MTGPRLLVHTPSRLHFGLLGWGPHSLRQFGGVGLMIEFPPIELTAETEPSPLVAGPLAHRVKRILDGLRDGVPDSRVLFQSISIRVNQAPPEHAGLGVGTQLSLAIAAAAIQLAGHPIPPVEQLARLTGRGGRSGIGLHGFQHGGLIVDGGRKGAGDVPPLLARHAFPGEWSVVVVHPPGHHGLSGADEVRAFAELPPIRESVTERLCRIVLLAILPAVVERDLVAFGSALEELQAHMAACFAAAQGGPYRSPSAVEIINSMHRSGFVGCGQSSWGPTLYGFSDRPRADVERTAEALRQCLALEKSAVVVTGADNHGARIETA